MTKWPIAAFSASCASLLTLPAGAAEPVQPYALSLAEASRVIDAGIAQAEALHAHAVIAVVDAEGLLVEVRRMDNPDMYASIELAPAKARAAAMFKKPSADLEAAVDKGRFAEVTAPGFTLMAGGVPLVVNGQIVGAVGASASTPAQDKQIAETAAQALAKGH